MAAHGGPPPKVSVGMITFNQARFIGQALDSALMQRTSFDYEVVIGDDCSTDGTTEIVQEYRRRFPDRIRPLFHAANVGMGRNFREMLEACRGEFVALLEGDDYWTAPDKLETQVELLERSPGCAFCHHRVQHVTWPEGRAVREYPPRRHRSPRTPRRILSMTNPVQTCAVMLRRELLPPLDEEFERLELADWPLCVLLGERGWIGYVDRTMAHYRIHAGNTWVGRPSHLQIPAMGRMARYLLARVGEPSKVLYKDMILALAFKEFALAVKSLGARRALSTGARFTQLSLRLGRPFWVVTRLWPYYRANYLAD